MVRASSLKIKVNIIADCERDSSSESGGSDGEKEKCYTNGPKHWSIDSDDSLTSCFSAGFCLCLCLGVFAFYIASSS